MITPYTWMIQNAGGGSSSSAPVVISISPSEGDTIVIPDTVSEVILNLEPAQDLEALYMTLPANQSPREGQRVFVSSTRQIDQMTVTSTDRVNGGVVMFSPGNNYVWLQNKGQVWSRVTA